MERTEKELAFLRDMYVNPEWTQRFVDLVDKDLDLKDAENLLYINAGTGDHCFAIRERAGDQTAVFAACENEHLVNIARDKAIAVGSDVDFSTIEFESDSFDRVIADASLVLPDDIEEFIEDAARVARKDGKVTIFLPLAGSYGEVFSLLWEVLFNEGLGDEGHDAELMISELPSTGRLKEIAEAAGLDKIKVDTANEVFEFENGSAFIQAPLVSDFLMPHWLETLDEEQKEQVSEKLAHLIDAEDGTLSFRFSVKATVLTGRKS